jgi:hypothetical protein
MDTNNTIEKDIVVITTKTAEFLLSNNPDSLCLYIFFIKNSKIQETNQIWNTDTFGMKGLNWGRARYTKAKKFLIDNNLIEIVDTRDVEGMISKRYLKINYLWSQQKIEKIIHVYQNPQVDEPTGGQTTTNALSNKRVNALSNTKESIIPELNDNTVESKPQVVLPSNRGKSAVDRLLSIYCSLYNYTFNCYYKPNYGKDKVIIKRLLENYTELQLAHLLISYFGWHGMTGSDSKEYNNLTQNAFPISWFSTMINKLEVYSRNVVRVEFDNDLELLHSVGEYFLSPDLVGK